MQAVDPQGTPFAELRWVDASHLASAWVRIPDGSWLGIEPRATADAPWGWSDRLWHAAQPPREGWHGTPLTVFEALDWGRIDRIPALAEPARLPAGGGTAVLNLIADLAVAQGAGPLPYRGPYPTEQLFLALLESFRYEPAAPDPLAAFMGGDLALAWRAAPAERLFVGGDLYVQRRERIEKVVWRGITYYRPDWQGVARHAPRRIIDAPGGVSCGLWALEQPIEEHLRLRPSGDLDAIVAAEPAPAASRPLPSGVWPGVVATVAARAAAPLASCVESVAVGFSLEWGPVARDLIDIERDRVRISARLRDGFLARLAAAASRAERATLGLALVVEIASLVGDELRSRAQAELVRRGADALPDVGESSGRSGAERAREITAAVAALLADASD